MGKRGVDTPVTRYDVAEMLGEESESLGLDAEAVRGESEVRFENKAGLEGREGRVIELQRVPGQKALDQKALAWFGDAVTLEKSLPDKQTGHSR